MKKGVIQLKENGWPWKWGSRSTLRSPFNSLQKVSKHLTLKVISMTNPATFPKVSLTAHIDLYLTLRAHLDLNTYLIVRFLAFSIATMKKEDSHLNKKGWPCRWRSRSNPKSPLNFWQKVNDDLALIFFKNVLPEKINDVFSTFVKTSILKTRTKWLW